MEHSSDEVLLLACRRGDAVAWEVLVKRYQRLIYAILRRAGLDEDSSADVFQEVFTSLFENLNRIEQPDRLQAWLVTTARRKTLRLISQERTLKKRINDGLASDSLIDEIPDGAVLPDELLTRLEEQHMVRIAIARLDGRCQKLLKLLFYDTEPPPSYAEIAALTGTPEGSIGPTRARCLQKLLKLLK